LGDGMFFSHALHADISSARYASPSPAAGIAAFEVIGNPERLRQLEFGVLKP
jgi:hypothetical protein